MKNIKLFNKILLSIGIIFIILILILFILGNIERKGYLSDISINTDATLKLNNIDIENTKKFFSIEDQLDYSLLTNYIFTNSNISRYSYNFRIRYYSKVFRNSDIYGVYIDTNKAIEDNSFIKEMIFGEEGSPFGVLTSTKELKQGDKIDNIYYKLKLKIYVLLFFLFSIYLTLIILHFIIKYIYWIIFDFIKLIFIRLKNLNLIYLKSRYVYILFMFLSFLIIPNVIYFLFGNYFDDTNYENRLKVSKPILSITNLVNYPVQYEKYFNDYIPFRNELIQLKNIIDLIIFKNIISDRVILGKDNWLFYTSSLYEPNNYSLKKYIGFDKNNFTINELNTAKSNLIYFKNELAKKNIDFILMICPDKQYIYSEYMPKYIRRKKYVNDNDKFVEYITNTTDINIVYPKSELIKYKDTYQVYYKYDSHWNKIGAYIGYYVLMNKLSLGNVKNINELYKNNLGYDYAFKFGMLYNDLANMISLSKSKLYTDDYFYLIDIYSNKQYKITKTREGYIPYNFNTFSYTPSSDKKIFIIRDSYTIDMVDYISTYFKNSSFININDFKIDYILEDMPDILVFETVGRDLKRGVLQVIPNYKIEEINKDLETNSIIANN